MRFLGNANLIHKFILKLIYYIKKKVDFMREITITSIDKGQRLDKYLAKYLNKAPKSFIYKMLRKKNIKHNHVKATGSELLLDGDIITLYFSEETLENFMSERVLKSANKKLNILFEDENILAVNKPLGILSHSEKKSDADTLVDRILLYLHDNNVFSLDKTSTFTPAIVNRLDRNTSGIVLCGKNLNSVQALNKMIGIRRIVKEYETIVVGDLKNSGHLKNYFVKDKNKNMGKIVNSFLDGAKEIETEYTPIKSNGEYTLVSIRLITGKSHQIRVHMNSIGHPLLGDPRYGNKVHNAKAKELYKVNHQLLTATKVTFKEDEGPLSYLCGKEITSPVPKVFQNVKNTIFL